MKRKEVEIKNKFGLHARPASLLVKLATTFEAEVQLVKDDTEVNAKSILGVMMLAAGPEKMVSTGICRDFSRGRVPPSALRM